MGKAVDLTLVQQTILDILHRDGKKLKVITNEVQKELSPYILIESMYKGGTRCTAHRSLETVVMLSPFKSLDKLVVEVIA